jgi:hypothetical protein
MDIRKIAEANGKNNPDERYGGYTPFEFCVQGFENGKSRAIFTTSKMTSNITFV